MLVGKPLNMGDVEHALFPGTLRPGDLAGQRIVPGQLKVLDDLLLVLLRREPDQAGHLVDVLFAHKRVQGENVTDVPRMFEERGGDRVQVELAGHRLDTPEHHRYGVTELLVVLQLALEQRHELVVLLVQLLAVLHGVHER